MAISKREDALIGLLASKIHFQITDRGDRRIVERLFNRKIRTTNTSNIRGESNS